MKIERLPLADLHDHPDNSNVMPAAMFRKLVTHLRRTDRCPPLIVRRHGDGYQLIDGHHRARALRQLGRDAAPCVVWDADDDETRLLLATLNRLQGADDPRKRAALLASLHRAAPADTLAALLPDHRERIARLVALNAPPPPPRPAPAADDVPQPVHFFLLPAQKRALEARLRELGGSREAALMRLVEAPVPTV